MRVNDNAPQQPLVMCLSRFKPDHLGQASAGLLSAAHKDSCKGNVRLLPAGAEQDKC